MIAIDMHGPQFFNRTKSITQVDNIMRQSQIFQKTSKTVSEEDVSKNARYLTQAGYVSQLMAGVYTYMPLGLRVLTKIEDIIRDEMNAIGASEILMPALHPKEHYDKTERWDGFDVLYRLKGAGDRDLALGATHEEVIAPLGGQLINSYKDLPMAAYQIQTKFRNEARAKSGVLRGREFRMKDMYSFHTELDDHDIFYEKCIGAYHKIYERCGIGNITRLTFADGGVFSKYSHEFQTVCEAGEDTIYNVPNSDLSINKEVIDDQEALQEIIPGYTPGDEKNFEEVRAIEVGNIFKLGRKFTDSFDVTYNDENGKPQTPLMGCYGIGSSRVLGTVVEALSDDKGLIWPQSIAPYHVHLISLVRDDDDIAKADEIYQALQNAGIEVLYDDRLSARAGEKFADSDLIGIPHRVVVSNRTLKEGQLEYKHRTSDEAENLSLEDIIKTVQA